MGFYEKEGSRTAPLHVGMWFQRKLTWKAMKTLGSGREERSKKVECG